jgi:hypothetical protein
LHKPDCETRLMLRKKIEDKDINPLRKGETAFLPGQ